MYTPCHNGIHLGYVLTKINPDRPPAISELGYGYSATKIDYKFRINVEQFLLNQDQVAVLHHAKIEQTQIVWAF